MTNLTYNGQPINQRESDNYVNLGQLCATHGKKLNDWSRLKGSTAYLDALSCSTDIPVVELIQTKIGGSSGSQTWGHPLVAIQVARWISVEFEVWCNINIKKAEFDSISSNAPDKGGFVYLIESGQTGWFKIGFSKTPYKRMCRLQVGNPLEITLIHRIYSNNCSQLERSLHHYYQEYLLRGEWFDFTATVVKEFPTVAYELDSTIEQSADAALPETSHWGLDTRDI